MPVTVAVKVTNSGAAPEDFFVDPRLNTSASITLASLTKNSGLTLPLTATRRVVRADAHLRGRVSQRDAAEHV